MSMRFHRWTGQGSLVSRVATLVAVLVVLAGVAAFAPASGRNAVCIDNCNTTECDFDCNQNTDPWTSETDGVWFIIHAVPQYDTGSGMTEMVWQNPDGDEVWAPMTIVGTWTNKDYPYDTIQASVDIDADGDCSQGTLGNPDYIRCHGNISEQSLCDLYGGYWNYHPIGGYDFCVDKFNYGVDFRKEVRDHSKIYCWTEVAVLTQNPQGYGLLGRDECDGSNLQYQQGDWDTYTCTTGDERGGAYRYEWTVNYTYAEH
jgi:hypothetical protein